MVKFDMGPRWPMLISVLYRRFRYPIGEYMIKGLLRVGLEPD